MRDRDKRGSEWADIYGMDCKVDRTVLRLRKPYQPEITIEVSGLCDPHTPKGAEEVLDKLARLEMKRAKREPEPQPKPFSYWNV